MLAHSWVQISISDLLFKCWNSAFLKSFYDVQKVKRNQHLKEITATNMKDVLKHGSFGPVCDPRMAKHFWISWMHARSSWIPLSLLHQGSHGRLQILLDSSHKIWIACICLLWLAESECATPACVLFRLCSVASFILHVSFAGNWVLYLRRGFFWFLSLRAFFYFYRFQRLWWTLY